MTIWRFYMKYDAKAADIPTAHPNAELMLPCLQV